MKRAAVILATVATIMLTASNPAGASERVTYGDVRAQFEAVENGGAVIITRKGFETTIPPASPFLHSIRPIQPFFKGLRYCGDAGRAIHVDPEVVVTPERALACVHADPHADLDPSGQACAASPLWASVDATTAPAGEPKTAKNASPLVRISTPLPRPIASRMIALCSSCRRP